MANNWLKANDKNTGLLYFDGVCGLCNKLVDFLISRDQANTLQFAPLQGETAKANLDAKYLEDLTTIVYQEKGNTYTESTAVLKAVSGMGGLWKFVNVFKVIPRFIRDRVYRFIGAHRMKWFGQKDVCRMPTAEDRNKILP